MIEAAPAALPHPDRRRRRSADPLIALHYQLTATRSSGELDAIVVADPSGVVVAGAGSWPLCEELAAYAPLFAANTDTMTTSVSSRVEDLKRDVVVRALSVGGQDVLLCARAPRRSPPRLTDGVSLDLDHAAAGVCRILRAAAA